MIVTFGCYFPVLTEAMRSIRHENHQNLLTISVINQGDKETSKF